MQNTQLLAKAQLNLISIAKQHVKVRYKDKFISIAAVLLDSKGNLHTGINIKYRSIWKCMCAERMAIFKAIETGVTKFDTIVSVKYFPGTDEYKVMNMCGECRQIAMFHKPLKVIVDDKRTLKVVAIEELLPFEYS